jgi:hypothetical protein
MTMKKYLLLFIVCPFLFIFSASGQQQIENPGFELWENAGTVKDEPVDWSTIKTCDEPSIANAAPVTFDMSTDAHSGNYALKLYNVYVFGLSATGAICNGRFHAEFNLDSSYSYTDAADPRWNTAFTSKPDSLVGWFKYFPQENDAAQFKAILHVGECKLPENGTLPNWVGMAVYKTPSGVTYDNWTRFSVPFTYYNNNTPEHVLLVLNSGDSTNSVPDSYLLVDDLEFKYSSSGIGEPARETDFLACDGKKITIKLRKEEEYLDGNFALIDLTGQEVFSKIIDNIQFSLPPSLPAGIYVALLDGKNQRFVQKVMIR